MTDFQKDILKSISESSDMTMGGIIRIAAQHGMDDEGALYRLTADPPYDKIISFYGINKDALNELSEMTEAEWITCNGDPVNIVIYGYDGDPILTFPLAQGLRAYKTMHWLPPVFFVTAKGREALKSA